MPSEAANSTDAGRPKSLKPPNPGYDKMSLEDPERNKKITASSLNDGYIDILNALPLQPDKPQKPTRPVPNPNLPPPPDISQKNPQGAPDKLPPPPVATNPDFYKDKSATQGRKMPSSAASPYKKLPNAHKKAEVETPYASIDALTTKQQRDAVANVKKRSAPAKQGTSPTQTPSVKNQGNNQDKGQNRDTGGMSK